MGYNMYPSHKHIDCEPALSWELLLCKLPPNSPPRPLLQLAERRRENDTAAAQEGRGALQSSIDQLHGELQELKGAAAAGEGAEQVRPRACWRLLAWGRAATNAVCTDGRR